MSAVDAEVYTALVRDILTLIVLPALSPPSFGDGGDADTEGGKAGGGTAGVGGDTGGFILIG